MTALTIHLGAHKTATTFIQKTLRWNRASLAACGVFLFPDPNRQLRFHLSGERDVDVAPLLAELTGSPHDRVVFSDEDSLHPARIRHPRDIYGDLDLTMSRIEDLRAVFDEVRVLFCVRDYAGFIPSVYQQEVKRGRIGMSFEDYVASHVDLEEISWQAVISALSSRFGPGFIAWDYERFRSDPDEIWALFGFTPRMRERMKIPGERSNTTVSKVGLDIMRAAHGQLSRAQTKDLEVYVARNFRRSESLPAERTWTEDQSSRLTARYAHDLDTLERICTDHGATFLRIRPSPEDAAPL